MRHRRSRRHSFKRRSKLKSLVVYNHFRPSSVFVC